MADSVREASMMHIIHQVDHRMVSTRSDKQSIYANTISIDKRC